MSSSWSWWSTWKTLSSRSIATSWTEIWHFCCGSRIRFWQRLTTYQRMSWNCRKSLSTTFLCSVTWRVLDFCQKGKSEISNKVTNFLLLFATLYFCVQRFSTLVVLKNQGHNCVDPGNEMCIALNKIEPCIEDIIKEKI